MKKYVMFTPVCSGLITKRRETMCHMCKYFAKFFAAIGAINWGLVAFLQFNLVEKIADFIKIPYLNMVIYGIVALSGVMLLFYIFGMRCSCSSCK
jgi:uncharacterized membrane protein YuzA (DUF378 family)